MKIKFIVVCLACLLLRAQTPIVRAKLKGIAVQEASSDLYTEFTTRTAGDSIFLSVNNGVTDIDILRSTLKETAVQAFNFAGDTLIGFATSGPDAEGWVYLRAVLKNGGESDIFRTKLCDVGVQDYSVGIGELINEFTTSTDGEYVYLNAVSAVIGIEEDEHSEYEVNRLVFALDVFPNPAINSAQISYSIAKQCQVNLNIYDVTGRLVKTLLNNKTQTPNVYRLIWQTDDKQGCQLSAGVYFIKFNAGEFQSTQKILLLK
ncbi:MAG: T9SS type A sorting domain-containing protein [bacterium]